MDSNVFDSRVHSFNILQKFAVSPDAYSERIQTDLDEKIRELRFMNVDVNNHQQQERISSEEVLMDENEGNNIDDDNNSPSSNSLSSLPLMKYLMYGGISLLALVVFVKILKISLLTSLITIILLYIALIIFPRRKNNNKEDNEMEDSNGGGGYINRIMKQMSSQRSTIQEPIVSG